MDFEERQFYRDKQLFESQLNTLKEEFPFFKPQIENLLSESEEMVYKENLIIRGVKEPLFCGIHGVQLNLVDLSCFACDHVKAMSNEPLYLHHMGPDPISHRRSNTKEEVS
jgi:hypothetical protein